MEKILQDEFTKKLLQTHLEIIKRGEIRFKKDFIDAVDVTNSFYWQIQQQHRNFPPEKQGKAVASLLEKYGVNPGYLRGSDAKQFVRDAQPLAKAVRAESVSMNFNNKREKETLLSRIAELEAALAEKDAELAKLMNKSDSNPDKAK